MIEVDKWILKTIVLIIVSFIVSFFLGLEGILGSIITAVGYLIIDFFDL